MTRLLNKIWYIFCDILRMIMYENVVNLHIKCGVIIERFGCNKAKAG